MQPYSGYYWQVQIGEQTTRSRSLWDTELALQTTADPGVLHSYRTVGPASENVLLAERLVTLPERLGSAEARIAVAIDRTTITDAAVAFRADLLPYLVVVGMLIVAAGFVQVTVGLRPLGAIRTRLAAIKAGRTARLGDGFPSEVQPLVEEVDSLLDESERAVERARSRAADLAHALKTPLQVLASDADRLSKKGEIEIASEINVLAAAMRRVVDRELAQTRLGRGGLPQQANVAEAVEQVLEVVQRTPDGDRLSWQVQITPDLAVKLGGDALTEALGNIIENAARHAKSAVWIEAECDDTTVAISTTDDGDGISADRLPDVIKRGVRLDEMGSGLGLAIVDDITVAAGGRVRLENRNPGLRVTLELPVGQASIQS